MNNNWTKDIEELHKKREILAFAGGLDRIAKQHASGKLTCRISGFYSRGRLAW